MSPRQVLSQHDPAERLQIGDFTETFVNETHWVRPYSCGGAGTTFSRAAVLAIDFDGCAASFARACLQSDWMISLCAAHHEVVPLRQYGCMCGQLSYTDLATTTRLSPILRSGGDECTFAHIQEFRGNRRTFRQRGWWISALAQRLAIVHATPKNASGQASALKWRDLVRPDERQGFTHAWNGSACQAQSQQEPWPYWYMGMGTSKNKTAQ